MKRLIAILLCLCLLPVPVRGETEKLVAITFDDGPSGKYTRRLLDGLKTWDVKATFLLCGYRMEQYPELTQRIFQEGHEIGIHGFSHKAMDKMTPTQITGEIARTQALLPQGCKPQWLRPPGGAAGEVAVEAAKAFGLSLLHWSVDPKDWATHDAAAIEKQVICQVRSGDIILLHDMTDSSVEAALSIIYQLKEQGFSFVTVSELAQNRGVELLPGKEYKSFP